MRWRERTAVLLQFLTRSGTLEASIREVLMLLCCTIRGTVVEFEVLRGGVFLKLGRREWWWGR
jgi:hypothetical protein